MKYLLTSERSWNEFRARAGGKAAHLARMQQEADVRVPEFFALGAEAFEAFLAFNGLTSLVGEDGEPAPRAAAIAAAFEKARLPAEVSTEVAAAIEQEGFSNDWLAVRSSGLDEDSAEHSFAGQFSSFLFQRGREAVEVSIKRCWASAYSERGLVYRRERGLKSTSIAMGVVIQRMVNADAAGVAFSRDPTRPSDRAHAVVSAVYGLGEGLVSGELDADHDRIERATLKVVDRKIVEKTEMLVRDEAGGLKKTAVAAERVKLPALSDEQSRQVGALVLRLEQAMGASQDCEWAFEGGTLYCVQTRPITTLPPDALFDARVVGDQAILWDNSNIIESYSGVTSPFTFSFASFAYRQVYVQFCEVVGVPKLLIEEREDMFRNMLGLVRGRIFYNLGNWYKLVLMLPGSSTNQSFMDTMMGVKKASGVQAESAFDFLKDVPKYTAWQRARILAGTVIKFIRIDSIVSEFQTHFKSVYESVRKTAFREASLQELSALYARLEGQLLRRWHAPIINDYLCMIFFGLLKKLTEKWVTLGTALDVGSLQNDLLCGQGELESTEPTKTLMRLAAFVDHGDAEFREWILRASTAELKAEYLGGARSPEFNLRFADFIDRYGFRCVNELKLEETDLHDDPSFALQAVQSYVRMKAYSVEAMEVREREIRRRAEGVLEERLRGVRLLVYRWVLKHARKAVKNRENLRFARTKIFGVVRQLIRGVGHRLHELGQLSQPADVFYLTVDEIFSFVEGRGLHSRLGDLAGMRKLEFKGYDQGIPPPDRFLTQGAAGASFHYPMLLADSDLLKTLVPVSDDPNVLMGTSCCPGVIEGVVRVVRDMKDAENMAGDILVTERTDPGWVPLYPSCGALLIERGSLLSHSAVVARELGLPTIVGVSGGLMKKLKTGMRVQVDAGRGEIRIL